VRGLQIGERSSDLLGNHVKMSGCNDHVGTEEHNNHFHYVLNGRLRADDSMTQAEVLKSDMVACVPHDCGWESGPIVQHGNGH
jgi:hypothetical protein